MQFGGSIYGTVAYAGELLRRILRLGKLRKLETVNASPVGLGRLDVSVRSLQRISAAAKGFEPVSALRVLMLVRVPPRTLTID